MCANPNRAAQLLTLKAPKRPIAPAGSKSSGLVQVDVQLDENGHVVDATATQGPADLRPAAVQAARASSYAPALNQCVPIASVYTYRVFFQ